jgi:predicted kinase
MLIQMSGAPGSGKSTLAKLLQKSIGGSLVIDHDLIRSAILDSSGDLPFDHAAKAAYNSQWALADSALEQGLAVIVDSTCNFQEVVDTGSALAQKHGCVYWYVECYVEDIDLLDRRLRARVPMRSQRASVSDPPDAARSARTGEDSRALFRRWIHEPCRPNRNTIIVNAGGSFSLEDGIRSVLEEMFPDE